MKDIIEILGYIALLAIILCAFYSCGNIKEQQYTAGVATYTKSVPKTAKVERSEIDRIGRIYNQLRDSAIYYKSMAYNTMATNERLLRDNKDVLATNKYVHSQNDSLQRVIKGLQEHVTALTGSMNEQMANIERENKLLNNRETDLSAIKEFNIQPQTQGQPLPQSQYGTQPVPQNEPRYQTQPQPRNTEPRWDARSATFKDPYTNQSHTNTQVYVY